MNTPFEDSKNFDSSISKVLKVVVIEDHASIGEMVCDVINQMPTLEVVGHAQDGAEGYSLCMDKKPDVLILDAMLPTMNGVEILRRLMQHLPRVRTLVYTAGCARYTISSLLRYGLAGYIRKDSSLADFKSAVESVAMGASCYGAEVAEVLRATLESCGELNGLSVLTERELQVAQLVAEGYSNKLIAKKLEIMLRTVDSHRLSIKCKLNVCGVAGLTRWAVAHGLVEAVRTEEPSSLKG